jgi:parvulin-like peptidyl-prolyl isomerase
VIVLATSCAGGSDATVVDGVEITSEDFAALHGDVDDLDDDERAGSMLLLILREAFGARAEAELGIAIEVEAVDVAYQEQIERYEGRGGIDTVLDSLNQTTARARIEAELDTIRDAVAARLVRTESPGFDLELAYETYLLSEAEVCVRQMQLESAPDFDVARTRLDAGEDFGDVARDISIDPFIDREEGVGAGGDLGCSAPNALPGGFDTATITAPLGEPTGPVVADTGLYLVLVYDRTAPDLDDVRDEVIERAVESQGPELFRRWAVDVLQTIEVELASGFGEWAMLPETDPVPTVVAPYRTDDIIDESS